MPVEAGQAEVSTSAQEQKVANALELATRLTDKQQLLTLQSNAAERGAQEIVEATTARLDELFPQAVKAQRVARARVAVPKNEDVNLLWHAGRDADWEKALSDYDKLLLPANVDVERRLAPRPSMAMGTQRIKKMSPAQWRTFLHDEYFVWKYTAKNRLATTRTTLGKETDEHLAQVRKQLLSLDVSDVKTALKTATEIGGLGVAGASGLLSLMYPEAFGTVDQFVVKALLKVGDLPEQERLAQMNPEGLTIDDGVVLTRILRRKAAELGEGWTPRKVEAALWVIGR